MNEAFNAQLRAFAQSESLPGEELTAVLSKLVSEKVYALPALLCLDQVKVNTRLGTVIAEFVLRFIRSLPLDADVLRAIGITKREDVETITKSEYEDVGDVFDNVKSESSVEEKLKVGPPASGRLWKFAERFASAGRLVSFKIMYSDRIMITDKMVNRQCYG